jgi:hypothetical protein
VITTKTTDLTIEIQCMWSVKTNVISVLTGATGTTSRSFIKYLSNILDEHKIKDLQKTTIFSMVCILQKVQKNLTLEIELYAV